MRIFLLRRKQLGQAGQTIRDLGIAQDFLACFFAGVCTYIYDAIIGGLYTEGPLRAGLDGR
jgi:hypothetical protein